MDAAWAGLGGAIIGGTASLLGTALAARAAARREASARQAAYMREVLLARYRAGQSALERYLEYLYDPPTGVASNGRGEAEYFTDQLAEPFGPKFAEEAAYDAFSDSRKTVDRHIKAMRAQLEKWEQQLGFPPREDLSAKDE